MLNREHVTRIVRREVELAAAVQTLARKPMGPLEEAAPRSLEIGIVGVGSLIFADGQATAILGTEDPRDADH